MAITQNTLIGRTSGRVGNAVFSTWKGRNVLKQKAETVANPRTILQQMNRLRFTTLLNIGKSLQPIITYGFSELKKYTWLNNFMRINSYTDFLTWDDVTQSWVTNLNNLVLASGNLFVTPILDSGVTDNGNGTSTLGITIAPGVTANQNTQDRAFVLVTSANGMFQTMQLGEQTRGDSAPLGSLNVLLPFVPTEDIYTYLFFISPDNKIVSNSVVHHLEI